MRFKLVESSLNLRIERGHDRMDYVLSEGVARKQLELMADIYCNVEYMECQDAAYFKVFSEADYKKFTALDDKRHRGILCEVKGDYEIQEIGRMQEPHMLHLKVKKENKYIDLIVLRILVAGSNDADYMDRNQQWNRVLEYIEQLEDKSHLVLTGDFNHGVISPTYRKQHARRFYNYQMVVKDLKEKQIKLHEMEGTSYRGYMKIDHIATGERVQVLTAEYKEGFQNPYTIGIPDHSFIVAELEI